MSLLWSLYETFGPDSRVIAKNGEGNGYNFETLKLIMALLKHVCGENRSLCAWFLLRLVSIPHICHCPFLGSGDTYKGKKGVCAIKLRWLIQWKLLGLFFQSVCYSYIDGSFQACDCCVILHEDSSLCLHIILNIKKAEQLRFWDLN